MTSLNYYHCDVFTKERFGGNQLAVVFGAEELDDKTLQQIAREFNFSETTFVLPPKDNGDFHVRIFTPEREVPFAGHPNVGTAFVLAESGQVEWCEGEAKLLFEELAGNVAVSLTKDSGGNFATTIDAPAPLSIGDEIDVELVAGALSLSKDDINVTNHNPIVASVGLEFILVELSSSEALAKAKVNTKGFESLQRAGYLPYVHMYVRSDSDPFKVDTRMYAPLDGIIEDPATGSANAALAAFLTDMDEADNQTLDWHITQGVLMGRPSDLFLRTIKRDSEVVRTQLTGHCVLMATGSIVV